MHNSTVFKREFVAFLINSSIPLYLNVHSDITVYNGTYVVDTEFFTQNDAHILRNILYMCRLKQLLYQCFVVVQLGFFL
jgi:hypothetical protein